MANTIIFQIDGGLGKSIIATAVLKAIKKKYRKANIIVVTGYPDVFINNPNANRVLNPVQTVGVYKNFIQDKEALVLVADPYHTSDFITQKKHIIEIWCDLYQLEYSGEMPELFISKAEKQYFEPFYKLDKPIMAINPNGGGETQPIKYSWTRDLPAPIVDEIVANFKADYNILHIKRKDQISYGNTMAALDSWRSIAIMLMLSKKRLLIDSSSMHIAAALGLPSVVTWIGTSPKVFGYQSNINIVANEPTRPINLEHNHYMKHQLFEDISTFPYENLTQVFNTKEIIKALK